VLNIQVRVASSALTWQLYDHSDYDHSDYDHSDYYHSEIEAPINLSV